MFYDTYQKLCEEHGEKPYTLPLKLGAKSNSMVAQWKAGSLPRPAMLEKIADYFGVSVGYLMDGEKEKPTTQPGSELDSVTQEIMDIWANADASTREAILAAARMFKERTK